VLPSKWTILPVFLAQRLHLCQSPVVKNTDHVSKSELEGPWLEWKSNFQSWKPQCVTFHQKCFIKSNPSLQIERAEIRREATHTARLRNSLMNVLGLRSRPRQTKIFLSTMLLDRWHSYFLFALVSQKYHIWIYIDRKLKAKCDEIDYSSVPFTFLFFFFSLFLFVFIKH
jgi:hypothetical protein